MNKLVILPATGIAAILLTGASSCSTQSGAPANSSQAANDNSSASAVAQKQNATVGQAIHVTDSTNGLSADVTIESVKFVTTGTGELAQPAQNGVYAVADVLILCNSGQYSFNPLYFKYQEPDGTTYDSFGGNALTAGFDPTLSSGSLNAGQKTRGNLVFDVKTKGGLIQVTDPLGTTVGQWTVPST